MPLIRQHIDSIIDLASTEHGISSPGESAALTARVIELRDTPGPDGKIRTWRTIAEICGTTLDAVRHRYGKGKATIRKSQIVEDAALTGYDIKDKLAEFQNIDGATAPDGEFTEIERQTPQILQGFTIGSAEGAPVIGHVGPFMAYMAVSKSSQTDHPPKTETEPLQEAEPANPEKPTEQEKKHYKVATTPESRTVQGLPPAGAPWYNDIAKEWSLGPTGYPIKNEKVPTSPEEFQSFEGVAAPEVSESAAPKPITEKPAPLDPETLAEVDRMLGEGMGVLDIAAELEKKGKLVPWTKIRARAAYLAKMKRKEVAPEPEKADDPEPVAQPGEEPQEVEATEDRLEPVAISRKELDLRMWDLHQTGKTPEEISDILFAERLYYKPKSVRVRLLSQGAKL